MDEKQRQQLNEQGYLIFRNMLSPSDIETLLFRLEELWSIEGDRAGEENYIEAGVHRLANLANKGELFRGLYAHPQVLEVIEAAMVNARDVLVFNGHCWHAGRPNQTGNHRRAVLVHYLRADVPRPENRRQHMDADHAVALAPRERELLGLGDE